MHKQKPPEQREETILSLAFSPTSAFKYWILEAVMQGKNCYCFLAWSALKSSIAKPCKQE